MEFSQNMTFTNGATRLRRDRRTPRAIVRGMPVLAFISIISVEACSDGGSSSGESSGGAAGGVAEWAFDEATLSNAPRFTVDSAPVGDTRKAATDSAFDVAGVSKVQLLSDGRFAALDQDGGRLLMFAADGAPLWHIGGQGRDERRFRFPSGLLLRAGDTLLVPDPYSDSLHVVHPDARIVRSRAFSGSTGLTEIRIRDHVGIIGRRLFGSGIRTGPGWESRDDEGHPVLIVGSSNISGEDVRQIATVLGPADVQIDTMIEGRRFMWNEEPRFAPHPTFAVWDTLAVQFGGPDSALRVTTLGGKNVARLVLRRQRRPVTPAIRQADIERQLGRMLRRVSFRPIDSVPGARSRDSVGRARAADSLRRRSALDSTGRRVLMAMRPTADSLPPFDALLSAPDGILWVTQNGVPGGGAPWSAIAFAPGGRLLGSVTGPGQGSPISFSRDRVVVRIDDGKNPVRLVVFRLQAP
jgi:hypothetical protein